MSQRVLVFAAHPDDEVLGCGGAVAIHAALGHEVAIFIVAEGVTSRDEQRDQDGHAGVLAELHGQARRASDIMGARDLRFGNLPDNRLNGLELLDVVKVVEAQVADWQPSVVYSHHPSDCNIDHTVVHRACLAACRLLPGSTLRDLRLYEVLSSSDYASRAAPAFLPQRFVPLSEDAVERKVAGMDAYAGELRPWPHPRSLAAFRHLAARRGAQCGHEAAEAFAIEWECTEP